jgi:serine-type D-Ala-D-Ala endopeptidase (penicillin-binding protein 7)
LKLSIKLLGWAAIFAAFFSPSVIARALPLEPAVLARQLSGPSVRQPMLVSTVDPARLKLRSSSLLVLDQPKSKILVARNAEAVRPIASITKLMTAMVVLDGQLPMERLLTIAKTDIDTLKGTHSRLQLGTRLTRRELLQLALMASENRAASALAHAYPGGFRAFVQAMNRKAQALAMPHTHFVDATGLSQQNVSTARDLARMVMAAHGYPLIRKFTTTASHAVRVRRGSAPLLFKNSNRAAPGHCGVVEFLG